MAFEGEDARRWSMTDAPTLLPAVDWITRSPNGPFLDTGINIAVENKGRVYLSVETIKEMAEIAGLLETKTAQEKSLHDIAQFEEGYKKGIEEGKDLVDRLMAITDVLTSRIHGNEPYGGETAKRLAETAGAKPRKPDSNSDDVQKPSK